MHIKKNRYQRGNVIIEPDKEKKNRQPGKTQGACSEAKKRSRAGINLQKQDMPATAKNLKGIRVVCEKG